MKIRSSFTFRYTFKLDPANPMAHIQGFIALRDRTPTLCSKKLIRNSSNLLGTVSCKRGQKQNKTKQNKATTTKRMKIKRKEKTAQITVLKMRKNIKLINYLLRKCRKFSLYPDYTFFHSDQFVLQSSSIDFIFSFFNGLTLLFKDLITINITFYFSSSYSDYLFEYPPLYEILRLPQFYTL